MSRAVNEVGPGDFIKVRGEWKEIETNDAYESVPVPRRWTITTTDGQVNGMYDIDAYAKASDLRDTNIPGTRVPDTPIHRASMWLEYLKFAEGRKDAGVERLGDDTFELFIAATDARFTVEQMQEAATYYGLNMLRMTLGGRVDFAIPSPTGEGVIDGRGVFVSLWLDAFMHGYATARGKRGPSNQEAAEGGTPAGMEYGCEDCDFHTAEEQAAFLHSDVAKHSLALRPL